MRIKLSSFLRYCFGGLLVLSSLFVGVVVYAESASNSEGWEKFEESVIRLAVESRDGSVSGTGTAFAINDNGDYITNHHVIAVALSGGKIDAIESLESEKMHEARIVWDSVDHDLAMVHVEAWKKPGLSLSDGSNLKIGQEVFAIGFPGAADRNSLTVVIPTFTSGVVSALKEFPLVDGGRRNIKMIQHNAAVNSGNSGGPLADSCKRVVGINEQKALGELVTGGEDGIAVNSAEGILFSINSVELMALLQKNNVTYKRDDSLCASGTSAEIANTVTNMTGAVERSNKYSNFALIAAGVVALLAIVGFALLYRRVQRAGNGHVNTRVVSQMVRNILARNPGNQPANSPDNPNRRDDRPYYDPEQGRIRDTHMRPTPVPAPTPAPTPRQQALYHLVPQRADLGLSTLALPAPGNYRLGRAAAPDIQLVVPNQYVSSRHLLITVNPDRSVVVEDIGSMNGTHVAGAALPRGELRLLGAGQTVRLGHDEATYVLQPG